MEDEHFDSELQVENMLRRCNNTLKYWKDVYAMLEKPFEWRAPTTAELELYIEKYANKYK